MITVGILTMSKYEDLAKKVVDSIKLDEEYEIILVDNGGKVGEAEVNTVIRPEKNLGISGGWNYIIKSAFNRGSEQVILLNDDIILHKDCLNYLVESLRGFYDILTGYMILDKTKFEDVQLKPRFILGMHFSCFGMTPKAVEVNGLFDENYYPCYVDDTDYYYRLMKTDLNYGCDRWAKFLHNRFLSRREPWIKKSHQKNRKYFTQKHGVPPRQTFRKMAKGRKEA